MTPGARTTRGVVHSQTALEPKGVVTHYTVLVGGSNGDGARRGQVTIIELTDPRPYIFQTPVHGRLIYTVIYVSNRLLT